MTTYKNADKYLLFFKEKTEFFGIFFLNKQFVYWKNKSYPEGGIEKCDIMCLEHNKSIAVFDQGNFKKWEGAEKKIFGSKNWDKKKRKKKS